MCRQVLNEIKKSASPIKWTIEKDHSVGCSTVKWAKNTFFFAEFDLYYGNMHNFISAQIKMYVICRSDRTSAAGPHSAVGRAPDS